VTHYNRARRPSPFVGKVQQVVGDRTDYAAFERQMKGAGPFDCVIDMAGYREADAESAVRAFSRQTPHYVFCSTVDVYTKPARIYPVEEGAERRPRETFPYALEKARCERLLESAAAAGAFALTILRPAHTYGEGSGLLDSFRSPPFFIDRIRRGLPLIVHGDGTSLWTSCHRDDVGSVFASVADTPAARGRDYILAGDECMTWNQHWEGVAEALGKPPPSLIHIPTDLLVALEPGRASWCRENFQYDNVFRSDRAKREIGFRVTVRWVDGVRGVVACLDRTGGIPPCHEHPWYDRIIDAWEGYGRRMVESLQGRGETGASARD
jgi:nucleoside-diphosphate-sugar epimerase